MREKFLAYLSDPESGEKFSLRSFRKENEHVIDGLLVANKSWYPIIGGIPRILVGSLRTVMLQTHQDFLAPHRNLLGATVVKDWQRAIDDIPDLDAFLAHQKKTAESFSFEWKHIYKENEYERQNFFHFLSPFVDESNLRGRSTIDIGCGSGRFTKWAALSGTDVSFGTDLGETVEVAYEMTKDLPNTCIVQADIYDMPFRHVFDVAYSIGVLHHLLKPQAGFSRLPKVLKRGGRILIWVYNRRGNARAIYLYEPLRALARSIPRPMLYRLCYLPASVVQLLNLVTVALNRVGLPKVAKRMPFSYYANFPFNMKLNDAFDVLATPKSNYYYKVEVEGWFKKSGLEGIGSFEHPEAGITCIGTYES